MKAVKWDLKSDADIVFKQDGKWLSRN